MFDYLPVTFFVEVDANNTKQYAKTMIPFMNSYYALEDNKKKASKYFSKLEEHMNPAEN